MSTNYTVSVEPFAERHYIKRFQRKYKDAWDKTWLAIREELKFFDSLPERNIATIITHTEEIKICKTEFRIAKTKQSRHGSGNRCIIAVYTKKQEIAVLLVYHKTDLPRSGSETASWKRMITRNYPALTATLSGAQPQH